MKEPRDDGNGSVPFAAGAVDGSTGAPLLLTAAATVFLQDNNFLFPLRTSLLIPIFINLKFLYTRDKKKHMQHKWDPTENEGKSIHLRINLIFDFYSMQKKKKNNDAKCIMLVVAFIGHK